MGMAGSTSPIPSSSNSKRHSTCNIFLFGEVLEDAIRGVLEVNPSTLLHLAHLIVFSLSETVGERRV
jgi:hypothetical protein